MKKKRQRPLIISARSALSGRISELRRELVWVWDGVRVIYHQLIEIACLVMLVWIERARRWLRKWQ